MLEETSAALYSKINVAGVNNSVDGRLSSVALKFGIKKLNYASPRHKAATMLLGKTPGTGSGSSSREACGFFVDKEEQTGVDRIVEGREQHFRETLVAGHEVLKNLQDRDWGQHGAGVFQDGSADLVPRFVEVTGLGLECEAIVVNIVKWLFIVLSVSPA